MAWLQPNFHARYSNLHGTAPSGHAQAWCVQISLDLIGKSGLASLVQMASRLFLKIGGVLMSESALSYFRALRSNERFTRLLSRSQRLNRASISEIRPRLNSLSPWQPDWSVPKAGFSFVAKMTDLGETAVGIGFSEIELVAKQKAVSEAYERLVYQVMKTECGSLTSSGWAAHPILEQAVANAKAELLERDAVITQWLKKIPFHALSVSAAEQNKLLEVSRTCSFKPVALLMTTEGFTPTVTVVRRDLVGRTITASATGNTLKLGLRKANTELDRLQKYVIGGLFRERSSINELPALLEQSSYYLHTNFPDWPIGSEISISSAEKIWRQELDLAKYAPIRTEVMAEGDLFVVRATSDKIQQLYVGPTEVAIKNGLINFCRIENTAINLERHICF